MRFQGQEVEELWVLLPLHHNLDLKWATRYYHFGSWSLAVRLHELSLYSLRSMAGTPLVHYLSPRPATPLTLDHFAQWEKVEGLHLPYGQMRRTPNGDFFRLPVNTQIQIQIQIQAISNKLQIQIQIHFSKCRYKCEWHGQLHNGERFDLVLEVSVRFRV